MCRCDMSFLCKRISICSITYFMRLYLRLLLLCYSGISTGNVFPSSTIRTPSTTTGSPCGLCGPPLAGTECQNFCDQNWLVQSPTFEYVDDGSDCQALKLTCSGTSGASLGTRLIDTDTGDDYFAQIDIEQNAGSQVIAEYTLPCFEYGWGIDDPAYKGTNTFYCEVQSLPVNKTITTSTILPTTQSGDQDVTPDVNGCYACASPTNGDQCVEYCTEGFVPNQNEFIYETTTEGCNSLTIKCRGLGAASLGTKVESLSENWTYYSALDYQESPDDNQLVIAEFTLPCLKYGWGIDDSNLRGSNTFFCEVKKIPPNEVTNTPWQAFTTIPTTQSVTTTVGCPICEVPTIGNDCFDYCSLGWQATTLDISHSLNDNGCRTLHLECTGYGGASIGTQVRERGTQNWYYTEIAFDSGASDSVLDINGELPCEQYGWGFSDETYEGSNIFYCIVMSKISNTTTTTTTTTSTTTEIKMTTTLANTVPECVDSATFCTANKAMCSIPTYQSVMSANCKKTCGLCPGQCSIAMDNANCTTWATSGFCSSNFYSPQYRASMCPYACGVCDGTGNTNNCTDLNTNCTAMAQDGYCGDKTISDSVKKTQCASTCGYCGWGFCADTLNNCTQWQKETSFCTSTMFSASTKMDYCAKTCGMCPAICQDNHSNCTTWASNGFCGSTAYTEETKELYCAKTCGFCGTVCSDSISTCTASYCSSSSRSEADKRQYCPETCGYCGALCKDKNTECAQWAADGFCHSSAYDLETKKENCAKTCRFCVPD